MLSFIKFWASTFYVSFCFLGGIKNKPLENISLNNTSVEEQAKDLTRILEYLDFEVVRWSRVPYLCEGDFFQSYYWLTDILLYARLKY